MIVLSSDTFSWVQVMYLFTDSSNNVREILCSKSAILPENFHLFNSLKMTESSPQATNNRYHSFVCYKQQCLMYAYAYMHDAFLSLHLKIFVFDVGHLSEQINQYLFYGSFAFSKINPWLIYRYNKLNAFNSSPQIRDIFTPQTCFLFDCGEDKYKIARTSRSEIPNL